MIDFALGICRVCVDLCGMCGVCVIPRGLSGVRGLRAEYLGQCKVLGLLEAIVATASAIEGLSPLRNFTTMVFGSEYPESEMRSLKSSR